MRRRVLGNPEISYDAWGGYPFAVESAFGPQANFGTIEKKYAGMSGSVVEARRRYSPPPVVAVARQAVLDAPMEISTSYVERQN